MVFTESICIVLLIFKILKSFAEKFHFIFYTFSPLLLFISWTRVSCFIFLVLYPYPLAPNLLQKKAEINVHELWIKFQLWLPVIYCSSSVYHAKKYRQQKTCNFVFVVKLLKIFVGFNGLLLFSLKNKTKTKTSS